MVVQCRDKVIQVNDQAETQNKYLLTFNETKVTRTKEDKLEERGGDGCMTTLCTRSVQMYLACRRKLWQQRSSGSEGWEAGRSSSPPGSGTWSSTWGTSYFYHNNLFTIEDFSMEGLYQSAMREDCGMSGTLHLVQPSCGSGQMALSRGKSGSTASGCCSGF